MSVEGERRAGRGSKSERFEMRLDARLIERLDRWRGEQEDKPSRAEAVRRLVEAGLAGGRRAFSIGDGEKLLLAMVSDIYARTVPDGEFDAAFVTSALYGGHHWGLEWGYPGLFHGHVDSPAVVSEVVNILDMWSSVESSFDRLASDARTRVEAAAGQDRALFRFAGFDGNNESEHLSAARFMIEKLERFPAFKTRELNSHWPMLERYRAQYRAFEPIRARARGELLRAADLIEIMRER
ncbi:MAG TPA: YfbU family protein [Allosphingosinicella sp.]|jgi:hypothetical protein